MLYSYNARAAIEDPEDIFSTFFFISNSAISQRGEDENSAMKNIAKKSELNICRMNNDFSLPCQDSDWLGSLRVF
jgi:hypothetical protein